MPAEPAQRRLLPALQILAIWAAGLGAAAQFGKISLIQRYGPLVSFS